MSIAQVWANVKYVLLIPLNWLSLILNWLWKYFKLNEAYEKWVPAFSAQLNEAKCLNCTRNAVTYCVDCKKTYCRFCTVLLHHPDTKPEKHSIEEIMVKRHGVLIFTPLLLDILLLVAFGFLFSGAGITDEYFKGISYCPAITRGRWWLSNFDATLFFYYKDYLAKLCNWEDSYWRFFMDTWVRGIATGTDSWLLLLTEFVYAISFEEFVRLVIAPLIGYSYAVAANIGRLIESSLYDFIYTHEDGEAHRLTGILQKIERVVDKFHCAEKLKIVDKKKPPPPTFFRKRPSSDVVEFCNYVWDRHTRLIGFYKSQAMSACNFIMRGSLAAAFVIRFICVAFGGGFFSALFRIFGFGARLDREATLFVGTTGIQLNQSSSYLSDWLALWGVQKVLGFLPQFESFHESVNDSLSTGKGVFVALARLLSALAPLFLRYWPLLIILLPPLLFKFWFLPKQQKKFIQDWKQTTKELWGDMSRDNPCGGKIGWESVRFSDEPEAK